MVDTSSLLAKDRGLYFGVVSDSLSVIGSGLTGCIVTPADGADDFFDLRNGMAGEIFQKFASYHFPVVFVVPTDHGHGDRLTELIRDHRKHSTVRFSVL